MLAWQLGFVYTVYCSTSFTHPLPAAETIIIKSSVNQAVSGLCRSMARLLNRTSSPSENAYFPCRISPRPSKVITTYDEKLPCQMTGEFCIIRYLTYNCADLITDVLIKYIKQYRTITFFQIHSFLLSDNRNNARSDTSCLSIDVLYDVKTFCSSLQACKSMIYLL